MTRDDLAKSIADYLETADSYPSWTKRQCAENAVRLAVEDAWRETLRVIAEVRGG